MLQFELSEERTANILVIGVGGAGSNAVNRMIESGTNAVDFMVINTDKQALANCSAENKLQIGEKLTKGQGSGGNPEVGQKSAEENVEDITKFMRGYEMVFITAGLGGGTGTGAAPIIARVAKEMGILTVGVVTKPFSFEGGRRAKHAAKGEEYLGKFVDSLVVVMNDRILDVSDNDTGLLDAFQKADEVLKQGVLGITSLITEDGLINLDFADVETVMRNRGIAHMGVGSGKGDRKVTDAIKNALESPLLETSVAGAKAILINIVGGKEIKMKEVSDIGEQIQMAANEDAIIILGASIKPELNDELLLTVIATGFDEEEVYEAAEALHKEKASMFGLKPNDTQYNSNVQQQTAPQPQEVVVEEEQPEQPKENKFFMPDFLQGNSGTKNPLE